MELSEDFYVREDVVYIAKELIGKVLFTCYNGEVTGGVICETEAYNGIVDRASHAYGGRHTRRTGVMYRKGGIAYVYLCYGIHSLFNVVTNTEGVPHAVLIRGIKPYININKISSRLNREIKQQDILRGPGIVSRSLGIHYKDTGTKLTRTTESARKTAVIWIEDHTIEVPDHELKVTARIGVNYAEEDALLPYRFVWA